MPVQKCPCAWMSKRWIEPLIPAAIYDYCRTETDKPIRVGDGVIMHTDRQVQDDLLCLDCEDILNAGGETWVSKKFATLRNGFPLYDLVTSVPPMWQDP